MEKSSNISMEEVFKYRTGLIENGKKVTIENPDNLSIDELQALTAKIFEELDKLDMSMGYPHHDTGVRRPASIYDLREQEIWIDFLDWYNVVPTQSNIILGYVRKNYPKSKYPKVLCIGDGEHCHLGRKLAALGYTVVVVDTVSKKEFTIPKQENGGMLRVVQGEFHETSEDMMDWANLIVGAKVPQCAEILTKTKKPTIFNISGNAEIYHMRFNGKEIHSSEELEKEIEKLKNVKKIMHTDSFGRKNYIYVCNEREYEER